MKVKVKAKARINRILKMTVSSIIILTLLSSCGVQPRVIDDLAIVFGLGIDTDPEDSRILKLSTSNPTQEQYAKEPIVTSTIKAYGVDGFIRNWQYQRHKRLALGKIQVMIFGENVIRDNFALVLQEFREVPEIDINTRVVFYDGQPQELFHLDIVEEQRNAIYLSEVINKCVQGSILPNVTLHTLSTDLLNRGKTAYLPYIDVNEQKDRIIVKGLAFLDDTGKLATIINDLETIHFMLLTAQRVGAMLDTKVSVEPGKEGTLIYEILHSSIKIDTQIVNGKPEINVKLTGRAEIKELSAQDVEIVDEETFDRLNQQVTKHLTVRIQKLLDKFQDYNVDPLGFGELMRVRHRDYFKGETWKEDYPEIKITNEVDITFRRANGFKRTH